MAEQEKILRIKLLGDKETQASLVKLQTTVDRLGRERKKLNDAERKGLITSKQASRQRLLLNTQLKVARTNLNALTRQQLLANGAIKKGVGLTKSITGGFQAMAVRLGLATAAFLLIKNAIGGAFNIVKDFQQANADLAAILGKTRAEITLLTEDAKRLGGTTKFTATEVSKLQKEFAKLGFSTKEILDATEATLDLAAATGTDLARAAEVTGATIRGFGLDASETQRVVDVMAKSFSSSALDMEKFATAMSKIAPVAKAVGLTIEETTGLMGVLADSGIEASTVGTSLRKIFIELSRQGLTLNESLDQIRNSTDKLNTAQKIFGIRAATAALVLAENSDKAAELTEKLNDAGGAAKRMAEEQLDTLSGSIIFLTSAWEGFILGLEDGEGAIAGTIKGIIDMTTSLIQAFTVQSKAIQGVRDHAEALENAEKFYTDLSQSAEEFADDIILTNKELKQFKRDINNAEQGTLEHENAVGRLREKLIVTFGSKAGEDIFNHSEFIKRNTDALKEAEKAANKAAEAEERLLEAITREDKEQAAKDLIKAQKELKKAEKAANEELQRQIDLLSLFQDEVKNTVSETDALIAQQQSLYTIPPEEEEQIIEDSDFVVAQFQETLDGKQQTLDIALENQTISQAEFNFESALLTTEKADFELAEDERVQKGKLKAAQDFLTVASSFIDTLSVITANAKAKELSAAGDNAKKRAKIEEEFAKKEKNIALAQAVIRGAMAVLRIAADVPKADYGIATAALIAAQIVSTIAQIGIIESTSLARGGIADTGGILDGLSHARGGIPFLVRGQSGFEAEGGEAIINKRSTAKYGSVLSAINQAEGGVAFDGGGRIPIHKFRHGTITPVSPFSSISLARGVQQIFTPEDIALALADTINDIKVTNVVTQTTEGQKSVDNVVSEATIG